LKVRIRILNPVYFRISFSVSSSVLKEFIRTRGTSASYLLFSHSILNQNFMGMLKMSSLFQCQARIYSTFFFWGVFIKFSYLFKPLALEGEFGHIFILSFCLLKKLCPSNPD
jgi:hypothetical protein